MISIRLVSLALLCAVLGNSPARCAASEDDRRVHYYFLRATLAGQSPFAKALSEFRKNHDDFHKPGLSASGTHPYQKAMEIIQNRPKSPTGGSNAQILSDLGILTVAAVPQTKAILGSLAVYSIAYKALTSPPMYAPRHYEKLAMDSQQELDGLRDNVVFFVSQGNAGKLSADEKKSLDLLFNFYTGVPASLSNDAIMADPLMIPVKEADRLQTVLKSEVTTALQALAQGNKLTRDLVLSLANEQGLKAAFKEKTDFIGQARTFAEVDKAVADLSQIACTGASAATCEKSKGTIHDLAKQRKSLIEQTELRAGIEQGIELGLAISTLIGNENLGKAFQTIKAVNQAVQGVSGAIDSFNSASTAIGSFAAVAVATTFVIGAVIAVAVILATEGGSADEAILAALAEIKSMIVDLSKQVEAGFEMLKFRTERLESLIESYGKLNSKNLAVLQEDILALSSDIRNGLQPLQFLEIAYRQQLLDQFKTLREGTLKISFALPAAGTALAPATRKETTDLFASLFAIVDAVKSGGYSIAVKGDNAVQRHFDLIKHLAAYPPSRFRTAFLLQNAINASGEVSCGSVNLIGYMMASEAAAELNLIVGKMSHYQLANVFADPALNQAQFKQALRSGREYLQGQRQAVAACVTSGFFADFEKRQLTKMLTFVDEQQAAFFNDPGRINNTLLSLQKHLAPPSGFRAGNFTVGDLIAQTRSFEPLKWEKVAPGPYVRPGYELGEAGFRIEKDDFAKLVLTPELRLAHVTGADIDYTIETWWQLTPAPAYQLRLIVSTPMSKKIMHDWKGYVDGAKAAPLFQYLNIPGTGNYRKLTAGTLGDLYQLLRKEPNGLAGTIDLYAGKPSWLTPGAVSKDFCTDKNGYHDCGSHGQPNGKYDPLVYWRDPPYVLVKGIPQPSSPERMFLFNNAAAYNTFRADFSKGMVDHVGQLRSLTARTLSPCLEALVQGEKCEMEGMPALYPARHRELLEIDNFNLIRATLDPGSAELRSVMDTVALSEIKVAPAAGAPDATIERIAASRQKIVERLAAIAETSKTGAPGIELPAELGELMENEYDWLDRRLSPFLAAQ